MASPLTRWDDTLPDGPSSLAGVALPEGVQWVDRPNMAQQGMTVLRAQSGNIHTYAQIVPMGIPIELVIAPPESWLRYDKLDLYRAASAIVGAQYTLAWGQRNPDTDLVEVTNYTVIFDHRQGAAVEFTHRIAPAVPRDVGVYEGTIRLLTVA